ncbi:MAG: RNA polymerase sigma factor [Alphaproteobacteria bacterium]|nr:RNA polymerase sigma factor [Alphaproteobacteria bacterium]
MLTGAVADADDLTQSALERALTRQRLFTPGTRMDSWVFRIAQNLWIDQMRAKRSRGTHLDLEEVDATGTIGEDHEMATDRIDIARTVAALPEEQRVVVGLVLVEGWSYQEAADMLKTPIGTVMSRLSRAREKIRAALDASEPAGGAR